MVGQPVQRVDQPAHRRGRPGPGGVAGRSASGQPQVQRPALGRRDGVAADALVAALEPAEHPAALADRRLDPVEQLGVGVGQPARSRTRPGPPRRRRTRRRRRAAAGRPRAPTAAGWRGSSRTCPSCRRRHVPRRSRRSPARRTGRPPSRPGLGRAPRRGGRARAGRGRSGRRPGNAEHDVGAVRGVVAGQRARCPADRLEAGGDPRRRLALAGAPAAPQFVVSNRISVDSRSTTSHRSGSCRTASTVRAIVAVMPSGHPGIMHRSTRAHSSSRPSRMYEHVLAT